MKKPRCICNRRAYSDMEPDEHFITCPLVLTPEVLAAMGFEPVSGRVTVRKKPKGVRCMYCGNYNPQAYKGTCPKCPKGGQKLVRRTSYGQLGGRGKGQLPWN